MKITYFKLHKNSKIFSLSVNPSNLNFDLYLFLESKHSGEYLVLNTTSIVNLKASSNILGIILAITGELMHNPGLSLISSIQGLNSLSTMKS